MSSGIIEIITGRERRRRWSVEEKLQIVAETEEAGARVTEVAARNRVYPGPLFTWRRQVRDGLLAAPPAATFLPVRMLAMATAADSEVGYPANGERSTPAAAPHLRDATIEITLANGCRLRVDPQIDIRALRPIVGVLRLIALPSGVRVWLAAGATDMRRRFDAVPAQPGIMQLC